MSKLEKRAASDGFVFSRRRGDHIHVNAKVRSGMLMIGLCAMNLLR